MIFQETYKLVEDLNVCTIMFNFAMHIKLCIAQHTNKGVTNNNKHCGKLDNIEI